MTMLLALAGFGLAGCGFKLVKQSDLDKMAAAGAPGLARPATPTPEPLHNVKTSHVNVELGEEQTGLVEMGEAGKDYADIPRYRNSRQTMLHETLAGNGSSPRQADILSYETKDSLDSVQSWYEQVLPAKGWVLVAGSVRSGESLRAAAYRKKSEQLTVEESRLLHSMVRQPGAAVAPVTQITISLASTNTAAR